MARTCYRRIHELLVSTDLDLEVYNWTHHDTNGDRRLELVQAPRRGRRHTCHELLFLSCENQTSMYNDCWIVMDCVHALRCLASSTTHDSTNCRLAKA